MFTSILETLASYRKHGHTPVGVGTVHIGRTVYAAGNYVTDLGKDGIVLHPIYRTDRVTHASVGAQPALLPASYVRTKRTVFVDTHGKRWYVAGYHMADQVLYLQPAEASFFDDYQAKPIFEHWDESFETAMSLAGSEVLARINANN